MVVAVGPAAVVKVPWPRMLLEAVVPSHTHRYQRPVVIAAGVLKVIFVAETTLNDGTKMLVPEAAMDASTVHWMVVNFTFWTWTALVLSMKPLPVTVTVRPPPTGPVAGLMVATGLVTVASL